MAASVEILSAIRELTNSKQIDRAELHGLLEDGINAALAKKHGPTVQAEVDIDENKGAIRIVLLPVITGVSYELIRFAAKRRAPKSLQ